MCHAESQASISDIPGITTCLKVRSSITQPMKLCWVPIFPDTETLTPEEKILGLTDGFFVFSCILVFTLHSAGHKLPESMCEHFSHFQELHTSVPLEAWYNV